MTLLVSYNNAFYCYLVIVNNFVISFFIIIRDILNVI